MKFILWLYFCPKRGCNSHYIHVLLCKYSCHIGTLSIFVTKGGVTLTIFMYYYANIHPILELWVHKSAKWWIVVNSGRWYRSCNWGNPFWVKLTSIVFIQWAFVNLLERSHWICSLFGRFWSQSWHCFDSNSLHASPCSRQLWTSENKQLSFICHITNVFWGIPWVWAGAKLRRSV